MEKNNICFVYSFNYPPRIGGESIVTYKLLKASHNKYIVCNCAYQKGRDINSTFETTKNVKSILCASAIKWPLFAIRTFLKENKNYHFKVMMSRSSPVLSHLPALISKTFHKHIKWIVSISDPIYNSPYYTGNGLSSKVKHFIESIIEGASYKRADKLIFTNPYMMKYILQGRYEKYRSKAATIPFGVDKRVNADISESLLPARSSENELYIAHIGSIYGQRNMNIIIQAFSRYLKTSSSINRIKLVFVGKKNERIRKVADEEGINDCLIQTGLVTYEESLSCMLDSDLLIAYDIKFDYIHPSIFLPSKLFDYLYAKKPIALIGSDDGPAADLIIDTRNRLVSSDLESLVTWFKDVNENGPHKPDYSRIKQYDQKAVSSKLDQVIDEMVGDNMI